MNNKLNNKEEEKEKDNRYLFIYLIIIPCVFYILLMNKNLKKKIIKFIKHIKQSYYGELFFIIFIVFTNIIFLNNTFSNVLSGYIFGFKNGLLIAIIGNTISSIISFYISKYYLNEKIKNIIFESSYLNDFKDLITYEKKISNFEWYELILLSRITPLYSYQIISYYWGVTNIPLKIFIIGTIIGSLPTCIFDTYVGSLINNMDNIFKNDIKMMIVSFVLFLLLMIFSSHQIHNIIEHIK